MIFKILLPSSSAYLCGLWSQFAWLAPLGMLGWLFDTAENITHFMMARNYPHLSNFALKFGPQFTYCKWGLAIVTPLVAVAGFVARLV